MRDRAVHGHGHLLARGDLLDAGRRLVLEKHSTAQRELAGI